MFFWKFRNYQDKNPVVFIPGLFGSLGNDIIPGTGRFDFGPAEYVYRPIINNLESMGYKKGKNLFIAFYDWRKENSYSAKKYIFPVIKKAKEVTGFKKVNLICHSMGGIVARAYIQSDFYQYDVDKVIMIGTPNSGAVDAYYFWSGGELPYERIRENFLYRIIRAGFLFLFKIIYGEDNDLELLHRLFPSVQELLPTYLYGNYLFYLDAKKRKKYMSITEMEAQNKFINMLNKKTTSLNRYGIRTYLIAGKGVETNRFIFVENNKTDYKVWKDGRPLYTIKTRWGDGTVTCNSVTGLKGKTVYIRGDHIDILRDSKYVLSKILGRKLLEVHKLEEKFDIYYSIFIKNAIQVKLKVGGNNVFIQDGKIPTNEYVFITKISRGFYWIILKSDSYDKNDITIVPRKGMEGRIVVFTSKRNEPIKRIKDITTVNTMVLKI